MVDYGVKSNDNGVVDFTNRNQRRNYVRINNIELHKKMKLNFEFKLHSTPHWMGLISVADGHDAAGNRLLIGVSKNNINICLNTHRGNCTSAPFNFKMNTWYNATVTIDNNLITFEIDGKIIKQIRIRSSLDTRWSKSNVLMIGQDQDRKGGGLDSRQSFRGAVRSLKMYKFD